MSIGHKHDICTELFSPRDYIRWGASQFSAAGLFFGHGTDNAWDEACQLVGHALYLPLPLNPDALDARLTMSERVAVEALLRRRMNERVPAAYLTKAAWFAGLQFMVDERVLVPRSPIAELIEKGFLPWVQQEPEYILDLCTGSGCIGIACAYAFPNAAVDLSDISGDALALARQNILDHELSHRVRAIESDLFGNLHELRYDLIVSNPPYVDEDDLASMPAEYHAEPVLGLSSGKDGLDFTRRLLREAKDHLTENGLLIVEVGNSGIALEEAYPDLPFVWLEFERGGHGVFVLTAKQLEDASAQGLLS